MSSQSKSLGTWRISNYTPEFRETSGVGKRPVLTPDEVLRFPIDQALIIIRGMKALRVEKFDYSKHPEYRKLKTCKASSYIPEWRKREMELPSEAAPIIPDAKPKKMKKPKRKPKPSSETGEANPETETAPSKKEKTQPAIPDIASDAHISPSDFIAVDKDSIMS